MKYIKCEWCNNNYDLDKYEKCPKCGGRTNVKNIEQKKWFFYLLEKFKNISLKKKIIICFILFIFIKISGIFDLNIFDFRYYYVKNPTYLNIGDGTVYIDSFFIREDEYYEDFKELPISFYLFSESKDLEEHDVKVYFYNKNNKFELLNGVFWNRKDTGINASSLNKIFKPSYGLSRCNGLLILDTTNDDVDDLFDFNKVEFNIDGDSYVFDLISFNSRHIEINKVKYSEYYVKDNVSFGNNFIYIDEIEMTTSKYSLTTSIDIRISSLIKDSSFENLRIFLKDSNGFKYRVFDTLESNFNTLLKESVNREPFVSLESNVVEKDFESLIFEIDGQEYEVKLFLNKDKINYYF